MVRAKSSEVKLESKVVKAKSRVVKEFKVGEGKIEGGEAEI